MKDTKHIKRDVKQVIVVRKDLNMRKGKLAAQVAHASLKAILNLTKKNYPSRTIWTLGVEKGSPLELWLNGEFTKIVVYVNSEEELMYVGAEAARKGISTGALIKDAGKTEFNYIPTYTTLALGPWFSDELDEVTGHLPLM